MAYKKSSKLHFHGDTLYIAVTSNMQDVWDDLKIPLHQTKYAQRYRDAEKYIKNKSLGIKHVVGHSLGGSTSLELQKNHPDKNLKVTTYGSPTLSLGDDPNTNRFRNAFDPVSMLDRNANYGNQKFNLDFLKNHSYKNFRNVSGTDGGWLIDPRPVSKENYFAPVRSNDIEFEEMDDNEGWVWGK